jgi:hypothetical protein
MQQQGAVTVLRLESETGWWLITHPDHAHLAGAFAEHWGNKLFRQPTPLARVLRAIHMHDDGWAAPDALPMLTRLGKPSAFSIELVGMYSAFEEIDLESYLAVRERAVSELENKDAYAALLVSMHTYNLLTDRADRSSIPPEKLPLLDSFLDRQRARQERLRVAIRADSMLTPDDTSDEIILDNFRLLQACDNLSLLSCVAYDRPATLLHPLRMHRGGSHAVDVLPAGPRRFHLAPYPFTPAAFELELPARHIEGKAFSSQDDFRSRFAAAPLQTLAVHISAT